MRLIKLGCVLLALSQLQGCVTAAVVAVASTASVVNDRRSVGNQIDDQTIELQAYSKLRALTELENHSNIQVISLNGTMLVVGQVESNYLKDIAIKALRSVNGVMQMHNQLRIGTPTSVLTRSNDVWLTTKVKTALFGGDHLDATNIKVITENGEVFLMGIVNEQEASEAVDIARNIGGVARVYKAFEYKTQ